MKEDSSNGRFQHTPRPGRRQPIFPRQGTDSAVPTGGNRRGISAALCLARLAVAGLLVGSTLGPGTDEQTKLHWERDSWRVWEDRGTDDGVQILFSTTLEITPIFVAQRAKGRLAYTLRSAGLRVPFSRKVAVRAVGDNTRRDVEAYLERQVTKEQFVDPQFAQRMAELTVVKAAVDLSQPTPRSRGRYWLTCTWCWSSSSTLVWSPGRC